MIHHELIAKTKTVKVVVEGRFDFNCQNEFKEVITQYSGQNRFLIDLSRVTYMDSAALGMLLLLRDHAGGGQEKIILKSAPPATLDVLRIANFDRLFTVE